MKKYVKRLVITLLALFALLGAGGTIAFASGYISWNGSDDYQQVLENLNLISDKGQGLKADRESIARELEQTHNQLKDKDNQINALEQEIEVLEKRPDGAKTTQGQLEQAEKDMEDVKNKSEEVLGEFD